MEFSEWITKKYISWRGNAIGNEKTITEFASMIGIPQSLMSQWMKKGGKIPKSQKYISSLVNAFGDEAYQVLGLPTPGTPIPLDRLPPAMRLALVAATRELADTLAENKIDPDSPEAEALTISVMARHGFNWTHTVKGSSRNVK